MNSVERVKAICKERKIPISRLERDLGYANGYIGQLRKETFPADRLSAIANYLSVSSDFLLTGEQNLSEPQLKKDQKDINEYEVFERLCKENGVTAHKVCKATGITTATISNWKAGRYTPKADKLQKIADYFGVSLEYLTTGKESDSAEPQLTKKDQKDIKEILANTEQLLKQDGLMFDGDPASPEAIDSILSAMQVGMELAKKKNKEKYTPKKYKKD